MGVVLPFILEQIGLQVDGSGSLFPLEPSLRGKNGMLFMGASLFPLEGLSLSPGAMLRTVGGLVPSLSSPSGGRKPG